ncbi:MAG: hypothetical protein EBS01_03455 [Verrucomicrobia bacterium]|nr:hypothetical protein [Verrucomicrobiota bacterium]
MPRLIFLKRIQNPIRYKGFSHLREWRDQGITECGGFAKSVASTWNPKIKEEEAILRRRGNAGNKNRNRFPAVSCKSFPHLSGVPCSGQKVFVFVSRLVPLRGFFLRSGYSPGRYYVIYCLGRYCI